MQKTKKINLITGVLAIATLFVSMSANAAIITFTNRAAFNAAAGALALEDFNSSTVGQFANGVPQAGFNGFSLTSTNQPGTNMGGGIATPGQMTSDGGSSVDGTNLLGFGENLFPGTGGGTIGPTIKFDFTNPVLAFGFDWTDGDPTDSYTLHLNIGGSFNNPPFNNSFSSSTGGFFGLISTNAISSAEFRSSQQGGHVEAFGIDNVATSAVPEPGILSLLLAGGLIGLGSVRRRR